ncbi:hypothetical protein CWS_01750 [Buchnera aphidicola str. JF99 (Acyrthosiphon pisum)]|nr:hypothetical protein CWS_01750 [Buchnera aphidicola str. JF99 (Acyrthosiphon pisum)]
MIFYILSRMFIEIFYQKMDILKNKISPLFVFNMIFK